MRDLLPGAGGQRRLVHDRAGPATRGPRGAAGGPGRRRRSLLQRQRDPRLLSEHEPGSVPPRVHLSLRRRLGEGGVALVLPAARHAGTCRRTRGHPGRRPVRPRDAGTALIGARSAGPLLPEAGATLNLTIPEAWGRLGVAGSRPPLPGILSERRDPYGDRRNPCCS